ncbi:MAG TPA: quinone-dependent dihydroorotate dehydrogenase [Xanthomonadaceae bacterium]|nr:quinone-dependent dihydroorotate dehydrogenase [Xanthomonadaceae bacterium]
MYTLARPLFFALDAERAHDLALSAIEAAYRTGLNPLLARAAEPLAVEAFGLQFRNPVGLAAGLDKNGAHVDALAALGFGFIEVGTVTPRPQPGNPRPRMFRLPEHQAVINRLGFNSAGVDALVRNLEHARRPCVLGINIGKNTDTDLGNAADDYLLCLERVYALADYVTVNVSSPNTRGLRELQAGDALAALVGALREAQERLAGVHGKCTPMLLKIAPDLDERELDAIATVVAGHGVDGLICTNTTVERSAVAGDRHAGQAGGLSGQPLFAPSTRVLRSMAARLGPDFPIIGVGGICEGAQAAEKIRAGARLVQFYTGMVYRGPALIRESVEAIRAL